MMNMTNTIGFTPWMGGLFGLAAVAHLLCVLGIVLLLMWSYKHLSAAMLKRWGLILLGAGIALCLVTLTFYPFHRGTSWRKGDMMMGAVSTCQMGTCPMRDMMDSDKDQGAMMMHEMMGADENHEGMTMGDMVSMLKGKSGDAFDKAFIDGMIEHHQGAIDMAKLAKEYAGHDEIKGMADDIISAQQREIDQMRGWYNSWNLEDL